MLDGKSDIMGDIESPKRDERGRLLPGCTANPKGNNGHTKGYTPYGLRARYFLEHFTFEELQELANAENRGQLQARDAMVIRNIIGAIGGKNPTFERESLLSRIEGQAKAITELTGKNGGSVKIEHTAGNSAAFDRIGDVLRQYAAARASGITPNGAVADECKAGTDSTAGGLANVADTGGTRVG